MSDVSLVAGAVRAWAASKLSTAAAAASHARRLIFAPPHAPVTRALLAQAISWVLTQNVSLRNFCAVALLFTLLAVVAVPLLVLLQAAMVTATVCGVAAWVALVPPATAVVVAREWGSSSSLPPRGA
jgi:hypothetical protein